MTRSVGVSKSLLIFTPTFVPDPASVGQHIADVAREMARRGHRVIVYTANRGYDDPSIRYPARELIDGVEIRRLHFSSFGKRTVLRRLAGTASFMAQCLWVGLTRRRLGGILVTTSPPFSDVAGVLAGVLRRAPVAYWAMDLYSDQILTMGKLKAGGIAAGVLRRLHRFVFQRSALVIALDRFMANRVEDRLGKQTKMLLLPPWPHEEHVDSVAHEANPFRHRQGLQGKFVFMYSGNHSPSNPLKTMLEASVRFKDDPRVRFLFVGGGVGKKEVESYIATHGLTNVVSLPYQPLAELRYSLSAADVHIVSLGNDMVGIVHPCKIYGAMTVGRPILFLGPRPSHISDILDENDIGRQISHGDVDAAVKAIEFFMSAPPDQLARMGQTAQRVLTERFTQAYLCGQFCDRLEDALRLPRTRIETETNHAADKTPSVASTH